MKNNYFQRNRYEKGMLLTAEDQEHQQAYHVEKHRLLNRSAIGTGIVHGFSLETDDDGMGLTIGAGLALDSIGREIYLPQPIHKEVKELFSSTEPRYGCFHLLIQYSESAVGEAAVLPLPDGSHPIIPNRIQECLTVTAAREIPDDSVALAELRIELRDGKPVIADLNSSSLTFQSTLFSVKDKTQNVASGVISVNLNHIPDLDGTFYSQEVSHGLGPGADISVTAAVLDDDTDCVISGNSELFGCPYRIAVKLFPDRGTFIAAVKPRSIENGFLRLRWYARKMGDIGEESVEEEPIEDEKNELEDQGAEPAVSASSESAGLLLNPSIAFLHRGQTAKFTPVFRGSVSEQSCRFQVTDSDGGTINADGTYTAPDRIGVFEIAASIDGFPEMTANALACVLAEESP